MLHMYKPSTGKIMVLLFVELSCFSGPSSHSLILIVPLCFLSDLFSSIKNLLFRTYRIAYKKSLEKEKTALETLFSDRNVYASLSIRVGRFHFFLSSLELNLPVLCTPTANGLIYGSILTTNPFLEVNYLLM